MMIRFASALRATEYWATTFRRSWRSALSSSILTPVLFLAAMGLGLGSFVDDSASAGGSLGGVGYLDFLAPGLLATTAMQVGIADASYPVMSAMKWTRQYHAQLATPLRAADVALGHLLWIAIRCVSASLFFVLVMVAFGAVRSWDVVLAVPAAALTGTAFGAPMAAYAITLDTDNAFIGIQRFALMPLFLFSGTFFPLENLPEAIRPLAWVTPMWHGVELCRSLSLGTASVGMTVLHVAVLVVLTVGGAFVARRAFHRRLVV
jgi:lipooligosaccharide transport system permease protein